MNNNSRTDSTQVNFRMGCLLRGRISRFERSFTQTLYAVLLWLIVGRRRRNRSKAFGEFFH